MCKSDINPVPDNVAKSRVTQLMLNAVARAEEAGYPLLGPLKRDYDRYIRSLSKNKLKALRKKRRKK